MYCLVFSVIFFIVGVIGVIPSFFAPLKIAEMKVCHPIPIIAKITTTINIQVKRPIDGSAANLYFKNLGLKRLLVVRMKPAVIENISRLKRKEEPIYKPTDL